LVKGIQNPKNIRAALRDQIPSAIRTVLQVKVIKRLTNSSMAIKTINIKNKKNGDSFVVLIRKL